MVPKKQKMGKFCKLSLLFILVLTVHTAKYSAPKKSDVFAFTTFVAGKAYYVRDGKKRRIRMRTTFKRQDQIITKRARVNIQIGPDIILHLPRYSTLHFEKLYQSAAIRKISLRLQRGQIFSKIVRKLKSKSGFAVRTPTITAGVRGTEFLVSADHPDKNKKKEIPGGVYCNKGVVVVKIQQENSKQEVSVKAKEQVLPKGGELKKSILDQYVASKMKIFEKLQVMKKKNYELLKRQIEKNNRILDNIRNQKK